HRSLVTWNLMIAGYAQHGHGDKAMHIFQCMLQNGEPPDKVTFIGALKASSVAQQSYALCRQLHTLIVEMGYDKDEFVQSSIIDGYGKCGIIPCEFSYVTFLSACGNSASLMTGRPVHYIIVYNHVEPTITMGNLIISMYGKCGSLGDALWQFKRLSVVNRVSWNAMLVSLAQYGCGVEALQLLEYIYKARSSLDQVSFLTAIAACSHTGLVDAGWTTLISGYADYGQSEEVLKCFDLMEAEGVTSDSMSLACSLRGPRATC
ncbi:hypothetical protein KP509_08G015500, partial [Ceratopteris richardii]